MVCVVSQRLVRTICKHCVETYEATDKEKEYLGVDVTTLSRGRGCELCGHTGYLGRTLVYEILVIGRDMRVLLERDASLQSLEELAVSQGFHSMFQIGVKKAVAGVTSVEELQRVLGTTRY